MKIAILDDRRVAGANGTTPGEEAMTLQIRILSAVRSPKLVKALRISADLELSKAAELAEYMSSHAPCIFLTGLPDETAEHVSGVLKEAGAETVVEPSTIEHPMLLWPAAEHKHQWSWRGVTPIE